MNIGQGLKWAQACDGVFEGIANQPIAQDQGQREHEDAQPPAGAAFPEQGQTHQEEERNQAGRVAGPRHQPIEEAVAEG
jgi:hypothetical protein